MQAGENPELIRRWRAGARRAAPGLAAVGLHAATLALLVTLAPAPDTPAPERSVVDVRLVTPPTPPPEPEPELVADPVAVPAPAQAPQPPPETTAPEPPPTAAPEAAPASTSPASAGAEAVLDAPGGVAGETAMPTRGALRGLACARAFSGRSDTVGCEASDGLDFTRYASGEAAARVEALTEARFNALFGLYGAALDPALRRLPGQQGMQVMANRRAGMSGADEMRDSLPPMVPDPAFGD